MKLNEVESAARKAKALAQAAASTFKEAAQKVTGLKKDSRAAKLRVKQAKKESKQAAKATRDARDAADDARRAAKKAAARAAKAEAKLAKARKKIAAREAREAAAPKERRKLSARATVNLGVDRKAARRPKRASAGRISAPSRPAVQPDREAPTPGLGRPVADFETEWSEGDLKENDSQL
jgi:DNA repair exonuclease SbcCD ATPase subunit